MAKRKSKPNIYNDAWLEEVFSHAFRAAFASPVRFVTRKFRPDKKKTSSKRDSSKTKTCDYIAYKFRGYPTAKQANQMNQTIGCTRFVWNRMLADRMSAIKSFGKDALRPRPAQYKEEFSWLADADSLALANVQINLEQAFSNWHSGEHGKPKFKKKHVCRNSYTTNKNPNSGNVALSGSQLTLPKVDGTIKLKRHRAIRKGGLLKSVTVTREPDGKWTFSIKFEYPKTEKRSVLEEASLMAESGTLPSLRHIGLDMSLPELYIDSDGNTPSYTLFGKQGSVVSFSKQYAKLERRIAKEQRKLSHMVKNSHNYEKQLIRIASLHAKAKHARRDFLRQMSIRLARQYDVISIEDLDIKAIKKSLKFGKSISDNGWGMFTEFLSAACLKTGSMVVYVDKWFPSSKTCHHCGNIKHDLKLNERTYICPKCGHTMNRDKQAAMNIDKEGMRIMHMLCTPGELAKMRPAC